MAEIFAKTIITKSKLPDVDFCFNPYIGCTHACVYCYARFMGRFTGHAHQEWGTYLDWKINAPELLCKELPKIKEKGATVLMGSVTDCYQVAEKNLEITRKSLNEFLRYQIPISILTKNKLVERDFDLLKQFNKCTLGVSISILDENTQKILEPGASTPNQRIELLKKAKKAGIKTYAFIGPIHPFLSDVNLIFKKIAPYVDFVMAETPNLQCGNWQSLSRVLKELNSDINLSKYKQIANSHKFFVYHKDMLKKLSKNYKIEFRGIFKH